MGIDHPMLMIRSHKGINMANENGNGGRQLGLRVSEKGAIMVTGLRKFPVTFYADEWVALASLMPHIGKFATKHAAQLKIKQAAAPKEGTELVTI
jgi:hypothetical protein